MIERFDPAELYAYEQARELSIALLKDWLVKYKFKNWKKTETRKKKVTQRMKVAQVEHIAKKLNDTTFWHSHGHGISMQVLDKVLGLKIEDFGINTKLNNAISSYWKLLDDYMQKRGHKIIIHCKNNYIPL